jgi:hypothetical protein
MRGLPAPQWNINGAAVLVDTNEFVYLISATDVE